MYRRSFRGFDTQMDLATSDFEHFELDIIVDHDRLARTPG
jgi:hypothetical protein